MNKVIFIGRLVRDPDVRYKAGSEISHAKFTIVVNRNSKVDNEADFVNCIAFGKRAEIIANYFCKGKRIAIVGKYRTHFYRNKLGQNAIAVSVLVDEIEFVDNKGDSGGRGNSGSGSGNSTLNNFSSLWPGSAEVSDSLSKEDIEMLNKEEEIESN